MYDKIHYKFKKKKFFFKYSWKKKKNNCGEREWGTEGNRLKRPVVGGLGKGGAKERKFQPTNNLNQFY